MKRKNDSTTRFTIGFAVCVVTAGLVMIAEALADLIRFHLAEQTTPMWVMLFGVVLWQVTTWTFTPRRR
jgi:hypothetical protein